MEVNSEKEFIRYNWCVFPHNETITQISFKHLCQLDYNIDVISFKGDEDKTFNNYLNNNKNINVKYVNYN